MNEYMGSSFYKPFCINTELVFFKNYIEKIFKDVNNILSHVSITILKNLNISFLKCL